MINSPGFLKMLRLLPGINAEEENRILENFKMVEIRAKDFFVSEGEICKQIGYVDQGCLSYYQLMANGDKSIIHFAFEDWWSGDLDSFLHRTPASTYWQAIEDTRLICISRNNFEQLREQSTLFRDLFQMKTQTAYLKSMEKQAMDKYETAEEKYLRMLRDYPQIIQRVPHYDVAAYLGIAPESLSRIRNKISKIK